MSTKKDRTPAGAPSKDHIDSTLASVILSSICGHTRQNPMPRKELTVFAPKDMKGEENRDRWVRDQIHKMRLKGTPICSSSRDGGYWIATSFEDYLRFDKQYTAHARKIFKASKAMRRTMRAQEDAVLYGKMLEEYSADPDNF